VRPAAVLLGEFHDQGDAKWIAIRRSLWGHNDAPYGWPAPGWPIDRLGSGCPQGVIGVFQLQLTGGGERGMGCSRQRVYYAGKPLRSTAG
jgi:hypothetical protein